jgi:hypothetical protein
MIPPPTLCIHKNETGFLECTLLLQKYWRMCWRDEDHHVKNSVQMKMAHLMTTVLSKCMQLKVKQMSGIMLVVESEKGGKNSLHILSCYIRIKLSSRMHFLPSKFIVHWWGKQPPTGHKSILIVKTHYCDFSCSELLKKSTLQVNLYTAPD